MINIGTGDQVVYLSGCQGPWQAYYTWKPRQINGRWYWLTTVYRRERNKYVRPFQGWEYGDALDLLR